MKKIAMLLLVAVLVSAVLSVSVLAASVSRNMPSRVSPGETMVVTFSISGVKIGEVFTLEDQIPAGWLFTSWDVTGAKGGKDKVTHRVVAAENRHGFSFETESSSPQISFSVQVPSAASGNYNFDAVYFDSSGQGRSQGSVTVRTITCGDGVCEGSENTQNCVKDCPAPAPQPAPAPASTKPVVPPAAPVKKKPTIIVVTVVAVAAVIAWWLFMRRRKMQ